LYFNFDRVLFGVYSLVKYIFSNKNGWSLQANNASENTIGEQTPNQSGLA